MVLYMIIKKNSEKNIYPTRPTPLPAVPTTPRWRPRHPERFLSLAPPADFLSSLTPPPPSAIAEFEESFSLVTNNNPLSFATIIRLAYDFVDEIKQVDSKGGVARIRIDSIPNNLPDNLVFLAFLVTF